MTSVPSRLRPVPHRLLLVLMLVFGGAFVGAFAKFVLFPAFTSVSQAPPSAVTTDGP